MDTREMKELKLAIIDATIEEFNNKGMKFTMDELAKRLHMSKKTIYKIVTDKNELVIDAINYCFDLVKKEETKIINDPSLDIVEKLRRTIICLPDRFTNVDWRKVSAAVEGNSKIYEEFKARIDNDWEPTFGLLDEAIRQKKIRPVNKELFKIMVEAGLEGVLMLCDTSQDETYEERLEEMINIVMQGIEIK
jgi:AcrR family transcriptional regulator